VDKRQIVLDTETTGLEVSQGHKIIEIGCVELVNRRITGRHFHQYVHPEREIDAGALEVHGITLEFLAGKPNFSQVAAEFIEFIDGAELIIHNAAFDVGFLDAELRALENFDKKIAQICDVIDTLQMARHKHPGQRNNLDALCQRYEIDNSSRTLHGALLDAEILAEVYLAMTGGQASLGLASEDGAAGAERRAGDATDIRRLPASHKRTPIIRATEEELGRHEARIAELEESGSSLLWPKTVH
jgi:DNA polymerase-3 subunit epsilon